MDECLKSCQRQIYKLPRLPAEIRITNYNPLFLMLWNMDMQFIEESTLANAQYVTGYMTKAEKSNMQNVWQEDQSVYSKLWSFGVRSLWSRECGYTRPLISFWEITCVVNLRPSNGLMCHSHTTGSAG